MSTAQAVWHASSTAIQVLERQSDWIGVTVAKPRPGAGTVRLRTNCGLIILVLGRIYNEEERALVALFLCL